MTDTTGKAAPTGDLATRLWESDQASALTNEAARRIEALEAIARQISETPTSDETVTNTVEFWDALDAVVYAARKVVDTWSAILSHMENEADAIRALTLADARAAHDAAIAAAFELAAQIADSHAAEASKFSDRTGAAMAQQIARDIRAAIKGGDNAE
mgnify:FL=1